MTTFSNRPISSTRWALASLSLSMLMPSLDTSIANVSLPTLTHAFAATFPQVQWIVLAYLLTITSLIVGAGRLGDIVGRRRMLLSGIVLFTVASLLCGIAPTLPTLIAARALQGIGAAAMLALTSALATEAVPKDRTGSAMGLLGTMSAIGTCLGPSLGGLLIAGFGWRTIFLVNVPIGIVNWVLAKRYLPADTSTRAANLPRFDVAGTALLAMTLAAYAVAMTLGHGRFDVPNAVLVLVALAGLAGFVWVESTVASPLLRLSMLRETTVSTGLLTAVLVMTVMMATLVVGPFYLSHALGLDTAHIGFVMSIGPLVSAFSGVPAGRVVDRFGSRRITLFALAGMATGLCALVALAGHFGVVGYVGPIVSVTVNYALFQASNNTALLTHAGPQQRGVIAGMVSLARNLGLITGASLMAALFAGTAAANLASAAPAVITHRLQATFSVATGLIVLAWLLAMGGYLASIRRAAVAAPANS